MIADVKSDHGSGDEMADTGAGMDHHHRPVAPDLALGVEGQRIDPASGLPVLRHVASLMSLTRAPLLQPPAIA